MGNLLELLAGIGIGGAVGAAIAVVSVYQNLDRSYRDFREKFIIYMEPKLEPSALELKSKFGNFNEEMKKFGTALDKLRRALRTRSRT